MTQATDRPGLNRKKSSLLGKLIEFKAILGYINRMIPLKREYSLYFIFSSFAFGSMIVEWFLHLHRI